MAISPGSDTDDDAKSFYTTHSHSAQPPAITTYPPVAAILPKNGEPIQASSSSKFLDPLSTSKPGPIRRPRPEHIQIKTPPIGGPRDGILSHSTSGRSIRTPLPSPATSSYFSDDDSSADEDDTANTSSRRVQQEHFFLIGDDMSAIPFFDAPRVIVANGPAPVPEDFIWHDEATYQAVLNKTTARCVNILGETALKEPEEGGGKFKLKLIEMCDDRVPPGMRAAMGKGYYCCLMQEQEYLPRACMAVYHINPHYSSDFLYRVKAFSYDSTEPLVAEQPESILLALIGRQMAISNCLVGVISNGSFLIVVEAGTQNSVHGAHLRTHPQAFVDCAHDWNDNDQGTLRTSDGQVHRSSHHQLHSLPPHAQPYSENPPPINPLERHPRNSGTYPWEQEYEARQRGFERADMMFAWYAVMLYAYEKHLQLALCALKIFESYAIGEAAALNLGAMPAMPLARGVGLGLTRNVAVVNGEDGIAARERYEELQSDDPPTRMDSDVTALGEAFSRMPGGESRKESGVGRKGTKPRGSPRINAPAPAWLRPASTASSRHHSQAYDYNYGGYTYSAVDSGLPSPTVTTPLEPASPYELTSSIPGSGNHSSWFGIGSGGHVAESNNRASTFSIPGTAWLRAAMPSSSPSRDGAASRKQPQRVFSSDSDVAEVHGHGGGGDILDVVGVVGVAGSRHDPRRDLPQATSPGWVQWSPGTSPRHSAEGVPSSSSASKIHKPKAVRGRPSNQSQTSKQTKSGAACEEMELAEVSMSSAGSMQYKNSSERHRHVPPASVSLRDMSANDEHEALLPPPADLLARRFGTGSPLGGRGSPVGGRGGVRPPTGGSDANRLVPSASSTSVRSVSSASSARTSERKMAGGAAAI